VTFSVLKVKLPLVTSNLTEQNVEAIPLSALRQDTTIELVGLSSRYPLNAEGQSGKL